MAHRNHFASDNCSGICPEALQTLLEANQGYEISYGEDPWTEEVCEELRRIFETDCEVFFVYNGTAANSLALSASCQSYHSIICADTAHVETDECGAPEFFTNGAKLLTGKHVQGKLQPESIERIFHGGRGIHFPKPQAVSVTQSTELGTSYRPAELREISRVAMKNNLHIHMDGARFANALAFLGLTPKEISWQCGVDVLCLGGTKNGLAVGEIVMFFNKPLAEDFAYRCKQSGQLASKMRFLAAPWKGLLRDGIWLKHAAHANRCAALLAAQLRDLPELEIQMPVEANAVFVRMPLALIRNLHDQGWHFYNFIGEDGVRLMCSWNTREEDIREFVGEVKKNLAKTS
ncbi:MAG: low specificity L-threonine aldolase [Anaerolineales bacterium]|nr:low specificity L-threonine aldolase [Anaerolineales bacterium]